jgi:hypothetical protein
LSKDWKTLKMKRRIQKKIGKQKKERSENVPQNMVKHKKKEKMFIKRLENIKIEKRKEREKIYF